MRVYKQIINEPTTSRKKKTTIIKQRKTPDSHVILENQIKLIDRSKGEILFSHLEKEHRFHESRKWRFDFAVPEIKLAIECDGGTMLYRGGRHNTDSDREKLNTAAMLGWRVIRFSSMMIKKDPMGCYMVIKKAMEYKG